MKLIDKHVYGPWALVTGASSGIGEEFARQVAASGVNRAELAAGYEGIKGAVVEAIKLRLAAARPAH